MENVTRKSATVVEKGQLEMKRHFPEQLLSPFPVNQKWTE